MRDGRVWVAHIRIFPDVVSIVVVTRSTRVLVAAVELMFPPGWCALTIGTTTVAADIITVRVVSIVRRGALHTRS
jgi:hypothetical protein